MEAALDRMQTLGIEPDVYSFTSVVTAAYHAKQPEAAARAFDRMLATGVQPTPQSVASYILAVGGADWEARLTDGVFALCGYFCSLRIDLSEHGLEMRQHARSFPRSSLSVGNRAPRRSGVAAKSGASRPTCTSIQC